MITDGLDFYHIPLLLAYTESKHHVYSSFFDDVTNNIIQSSIKLLKLGTKRKKDSILDIISNFLFYYYFVHSPSYLLGQPPVSIIGIAYSQKQAKHLFLFLKIFFGVLFYLYFLFYDCIFKIFFCIFIFILN